MQASHGPAEVSSVAKAPSATATATGVRLDALPTRKSPSSAAAMRGQQRRRPAVHVSLLVTVAVRSLSPCAQSKAPASDSRIEPLSLLCTRHTRCHARAAHIPSMTKHRRATSRLRSHPPPSYCAAQKPHPRCTHHLRSQPPPPTRTAGEPSSGRALAMLRSESTPLTSPASECRLEAPADARPKTRPAAPRAQLLRLRPTLYAAGSWSVMLPLILPSWTHATQAAKGSAAASASDTAFSGRKLGQPWP